ncbi:MAG TPA: LysE family transporter [Anaerovoracaceae bacterium]|nr:LysE family transporter [Anaerovoracaceae bacterium]
MLEIFLQSLLIGYSGAIMPGPLLTYTLDKSIRSGVSAGVLIIIGHGILEIALIILILLGAGKYLGTERAQLLIGIIGGFALLYFGFSMVRDAYLKRITIDFTRTDGESHSNMILGGALISALNPYFTIWWAAVGLSLIMNAYNALGIAGIAVFYLGHFMADATWYISISGIVSRARSLFNLQIYRIIIVVLGIVLAGFGISFLISSIRFLG